MGSGSSTHVANAYNKTVYVLVDAERSYVTMANFEAKIGVKGPEVGVEVGGGGGVELDWNKIKAGFSKILPGNYLRFDVDVSGTKTVYVSVVAEGGETIANALARREDLSVIISPEGQLIDSVYGDIWDGKNGKSYHKYKK